MTHIQDRHVFQSFNRIIQDLYEGGFKKEFYPKSYQDIGNGRAVVINTFIRGKPLDWLMIDSCISCRDNPSPERITADAQRYNTEQNLNTHNIQTLLFPAGVIVEIDSAAMIHQRQHFKSSLLATI